ncbi:alpha/beta hydrolase [Pseudalkalibacillus sp. A8]|uniref:alpha/beta hydrolase n=1 Tax=Pseudalkalibacillus sp. A8 TaxID=3382641 RepID=UPI0038B6257A
MGLHPQAKALLKIFISKGLPPIEELPVDEARASFKAMSQKLNRSEKIARVEDRKIPGFKDDITIRIYHPDETENLPALIFFHGGRWVIGDLDTHDHLCRQIANESRFVVISVDYSLAPERKFPVAVEDAYMASKWVSDHAEELSADKNRIAVGGDSAGGNLAAVVSYLSIVRDTPFIKYQILFYPSIGYERTASYEQFDEGFNLDKSTMSWFRTHYLDDSNDMMNPLAAPILIPDETTKDLPPAYILTAECDPLRDGGENYADKLKKAGVETKYACYPGMIHGFLCMTEPLDDGRRAISEAAKVLKTRFNEKVAR